MDRLTPHVLDPAVLEAVFTLPDIEGRFSGAALDYLAAQGRRRPLVLFATAPRSAGTFLRACTIEAIRGQLMRFVHAEGARDAALYMPTLLAYFDGYLTADTAVTHVHMLATDSNRHLMDAFDLRPIVMLRSIPAMLSSLWDLIATGEPLGFSFHKPVDLFARTEDITADIMIDVIAPWYIQYYASWKRYAEDVPGRVGIFSFAEFTEEPADVLEQILAHARVPQSYLVCQAAVDTIWQQRASFRCNPNHARHDFGPERLARLERLLSYYPELEDWKSTLLAPA